MSLTNHAPVFLNTDRGIAIADFNKPAVIIRVFHRANAELERRANAKLERRANAKLERRVNAELERRANAELERRANAELERRANAELERQAECRETLRVFRSDVRH